MRSALALFVLLFLAPPLRAQDSLPPIAVRGLQHLLAGRTDSAFVTWTSAGYTAQQRQTLLDAVPVFDRTCETVVGYDVLKIVTLSPHLRRAYILIRCREQPLYLMLVLYQGADAWTITSINWQSDPDQLLPPSLFGEQRPRP
jgi:hypothetical protein